MSKLFRSNIAAMRGYIPGEQPQDSGYIKLNTNENPYPPPPAVLTRLRDACNGDLRLYPDPDAHVLRAKLGEVFSVDSQQIIAGNGSDELLNIIVRSFAGEGDKIVYPNPTYGYYKPLIDIQGATAVPVEFPADYSLPNDLAVPGARITFLANPNGPSGTLLPYSHVAALCARIDGVLVVDEAYVDFSQGGCIRLIDEHRNAIVVRTMSKSFSLAGMRIGFAFAPAELITGMWKVKDHYNLNRLSLVAAEAALENIDAMRAHAAQVCETRQHLSGRLLELGFYVWDSRANFLLARIGESLAGHDAATLYTQLKERRILVRYFQNPPRLADCLRISIGTDAETDALLAALEELLAA